MKLADKTRVFDRLASHGFSRVVVDFSGGCGDGHMDNFAFYDKNNVFCCNDEDLPSVNEVDDMCSDMDDIVSEYFKHFKDIQYVSGQATFDVKERSIAIEGLEDVLITKRFWEKI